MPVAVNRVERVQEKDPMDTLVKGLNIAGSIYGIKEAMTKSELLKKEIEQKKSQQDFSNKSDLASKGLMQDESGNIIEDTNSSFYKQRMKKGEVDPITATLKKMQLDEATRKKDEAAKGKQLPASEAVAIGGANAAFQALQDAKTTFDSNKDISGPLQGYVSKAQGFFEAGETGKKFKAYDAQLKANAQIIGKYLEGGKMTDSDIERYKAILPNNFDSPEVAKQKATVLQNLIAQKQKAEAEGLQEAGFNVGNLTTSPMQDSPNTKNKQLSTQDRAAQILLKKNGLAGGIPKGKGG